MNLITGASLLALAKSIYYLILYVTGYDLSIKKRAERQRKTWFYLFWSCKYPNAFWKDCYQWIMQITSKVVKFNLSGALLFGLIKDTKDLVLHHLILIARHYIYTCKQRDTRPNVQMYIQTVQRTVEIEWQSANDHNSLDTFKKKWSRLNTSPL